MRILVTAALIGPALIGIATPVIAQTATPMVVPAADKKICKSQAETSSLIRKRKMCFTRAEWNKIADSQQNGAARLVQDLQGKPAGE